MIRYDESHFSFPRILCTQNEMVSIVLNIFIVGEAETTYQIQTAWQMERRFNRLEPMRIN